MPKKIERSSTTPSAQDADTLPPRVRPLAWLAIALALLLLAGWLLLPLRARHPGQVGLLVFAVVAATVLLWWRQRQRMALAAHENKADRVLRYFFDLPFIGMAMTRPGHDRWVEFNDYLCTLLGYTRDELATCNWLDLIYTEDRAETLARYQRLVDGEIDAYVMDRRFVRKDGALVYTVVDVKPIRKPDGAVDYIVGTFQDVTQHRVAAERIQRLTNLYAALSMCSQAIVRCTSEAELFPQICRDAVEYGGMKMAWIGIANHDDLTVAPVAVEGEGTDYLHGAQVSIDPASPLSQGASGTAIRENQPVWCQDFAAEPRNKPWQERAVQYGWGAVAALPLRRGGKVIGNFTLYAGEVNAFDESARNLLVELAADISHALDKFAREARRKETEAQLKLAADVFRQSKEGFVITDADARIVMVNHAFSAITGYDEAEAVGQNPRMLASGRHDRAFFAAMWQSIGLQGYWQGEVWNRRKDGSIFPEWLAITRVLDAEGRLTHYIGIFNDITQHKEAEERIQRLAHFDALTGLPNRALLADRATHALSIAHRHGQPLVLMFLDLDHFKNVNDSLGHRIGDALLVALARRLQQAVREQDTVARLGGDEFILLLPDTDTNGAAHVAEKLLQVAVQPYQIEQYELTITPSIGIAIYPADGGDFDTLSKCADAAMYRAKQNGRNTFRFFTSEMQARSARTLQLENALRRALARNQLHLHYQPQISLADGSVIGAEALLRWQHPEFGNVPPVDFIRIAEDSGQILQIGEWVLREAARQLRSWIGNGLGPLTMAVNLSAVQFRQPRLPQLIMQILDEVELAPQHLELELTESATVDDPLAAIAIMDRLHENGIRMSIDDFGTGYSSLSYLKRFQVYKLKIDRSFVRDIAADPEDEAIVGAIISMAHSLGMRTIAEGVETEQQLNFLREKGCDEVQGYYYSRPLPAAEFEAFVRSRRPV